MQAKFADAAATASHADVAGTASHADALAIVEFVATFGNMWEVPMVSLLQLKQAVQHLHVRHISLHHARQS